MSFSHEKGFLFFLSVCLHSVAIADGSNSVLAIKPNVGTLVGKCANREHRGTYFRRLVMHSRRHKAKFVVLPC